MVYDDITYGNHMIDGWSGRNKKIGKRKYKSERLGIDPPSMNRSSCTKTAFVLALSSVYNLTSPALFFSKWQASFFFYTGIAYGITLNMFSSWLHRFSRILSKLPSHSNLFMIEVKSDASRMHVGNSNLNISLVKKI